jgi:transposase
MPQLYAALPESQVTPEPKLEKRTRRPFSAEYKLKILAEADACRHGELGVLLRREKLYSGQLQQWCRKLMTGGVDGLSKSAPGPAARKSPEQHGIEQLEQENARVRLRQLARGSAPLGKARRRSRRRGGFELRDATQR